MPKDKIPYTKPNPFLTALLNLAYFPIWWYCDASIWTFGFLWRTLKLVEDRIAITLTLRLFFRPLFNFHTIVDRFLGPIFRSLRLLFGIYTVLCLASTITISYLLWLSLPFFTVIAAILPLPTPLLIPSYFLILCIFIPYYFNKSTKPKRYILKDTPLKNLADVCTRKVHNVLKRNLSVAELLRALISHTQPQHLIKKLGLGIETIDGFPLTDWEKLPIEQDELLNVSLREAKILNSPYIDLKHLFLALVQTCKPLFEELRKLNVDIEIIREAIKYIKDEDEYFHPKEIWHSDYVLKTKGGVNRSWSARKTPMLDMYSQDLTKRAQEGQIYEIVGKDEVIEDLVRALSRSTKHNPLLIGPPGSGKTTAIWGIAKEIIEGGQMRALWDKRIVSLDISALLSGTKSRGELDEKMQTIIREVKESGNVILFIDELHNLVSSPQEAEISSAYAALEPHLIDRDFQIIGATSYPSYHKYIEPNEAFVRLFEIIEMEEASREQTIEILKILSFSIEKEFELCISYPAILAAIDFSEKLIHDRVLPDKAVDLLDNTSVMVSHERGENATVTASDVAEMVSEKTHIPQTQLTADESEKLLGLEERLHERIVDQDEAITAISDAMRRARLGLKEERRPISSLLFIGPTGVGKTEMAKALAEVYFSSEKEIIRLDMSEYKTVESINRLVGAPAGQGYEEGQLTSQVRHKPFALILLDEIEKAHENILDVFLQVLDDGRLTDSKGRTVDFTNTIIIATSNAGANLILNTIRAGRNMMDIKDVLTDVLNEQFRPEFLNRFDGIIFCKALTEEEVVKITGLMMKKVKMRLEKQNINVEFTDELINQLARQGHTPELGARPLRRLIQDKIEANLAKKILAQEIKKGDFIKLDSDILD